VVAIAFQGGSERWKLVFIHRLYSYNHLSMDPHTTRGGPYHFQRIGEFKMHWTVGAFVIVLVAFLAGAWVCKTYPGSIPYVS
jgi:hypothetical protein